MTALSTQFDFVPAKAIVVNRDDRQRRVIKTDGLAASIRLRGIINPLIVDRQLVLIAGERRLQSALDLGLHEVPIRYMDTLDERERQLVELEENAKRMDLPWQDLVRSVERIHQLHLTEAPGWMMKQTGEVCAISEGTVSMYLKVAGHMDEERVAGASTVREAYNMLYRRDSRAAGEALQEMIAAANQPLPPPEPNGEVLDLVTSGETDKNEISEASPMPASHPIAAGAPSQLLAKVEGGVPPQVRLQPAAAKPTLEETIQNASFLDWAPKYEGKHFNLIHCDFPYGIGVFDGKMAGGGRHQSYDDSEDVYWALMRCLCENINRLASVSSHFIFWFSEKHRTKTLEFFAEHAPSIKWHDYPLIWVKSDNAGIIADARRQPRHVYETALLGSRGNRMVVKSVADAYSAPTDKQYHPSTKPEPMLKHYFGMLVDEHTRLLDPTCGSGSAVRAAEALGAQSVLGLEIDPEVAAGARTALGRNRLLAQGAKGLGL